MNRCPRSCKQKVSGAGKVLALALATLPGCGEPADRTLTASAHLDTGQIVVVNRDTFDWRECRVMLNPGALGDGYYQDIALVPAGDSVAGGLLAFADSDGSRFSPATQVIRDLTVQCEIDGVNMYYFGEF